MENALDNEVENEGGTEPPQDPIWAKHAEAWEYVRPPLRPSLGDIEMYQDRVFDRLQGVAQPRVLLLGCTPELLLMHWPPDTRITCLEQSKAMATKVFENARVFVSEYVHARLKLGNWLQLSEYFQPGTFDLVIGDGCYTQLAAHEYEVLGKELEAVVAPGCGFVHRFFMHDRTPWWHEGTEQVQSVLESLKTPYVHESFSALKLQLMVAMQRSFEEGVRLGDVYEAWAKFMSLTPFSAVKPQHYLSREQATIEHYRNSEKRYTFPLQGSGELERAVAPLVVDRLSNPIDDSIMNNYCRMAVMTIQSAQPRRRPSVLEAGLEDLEKSL